MNIFEKLQNCRIELQKLNLKKSGKNKFAGFEYYELKDFLPSINELFLKYKLFSNFSIDENKAILSIYDTESEDETGIIFTSPIAEANVKGCTPIQSLGAIHTYMKRYLYLNALEIIENDVLDASVGTDNIVQNDDQDIIEGLKATDTRENLDAYKEKYKGKVKDLQAFKQAYLKRLAQLNKEKNG